MTAAADVRKGQTDMPYKGEHQACAVQSVWYQSLSWWNLPYNHIEICYYHAHFWHTLGNDTPDNWKL